MSTLFFGITTKTPIHMSPATCLRRLGSNSGSTMPPATKSIGRVLRKTCCNRFRRCKRLKTCQVGSLSRAAWTRTHHGRPRTLLLPEPGQQGPRPDGAGTTSASTAAVAPGSCTGSWNAAAAAPAPPSATARPCSARTCPRRRPSRSWSTWTRGAARETASYLRY
jgi:hypothetical protein